MLFIAPLLIVIFFAPTGEVVNINIAKVIQDTLFRSLLGDFIALAMIGQVIWKSIDFDNPDQTPMGITSDSNDQSE